jgi:starch-binding outer membrane protein, SusD/RagB family
MNRTVRVVALAAAASLVACKGYLDVTNPGPILDSDLFTADAVPALVVGMSSDLSDEYDELARFSSIAGDESGHGGSYAPEALWVRGIIRPEDVNGLWSSMHSTRFEAESGVDRIKGLTNFDYEHSAYAARANMLAGFSDRSLGEFACYAVFNDGPAQDRVEYFKHAEGYFSEAIRLAGQATPLAAPNDPPSILSASYAGRASVRAWQGNWTGAVDDATKVPTSFIYYTPYSTNTGKENNSLVQETYVRREFSVFGSQWATDFHDPRVPWDTIKTATGIQKGQDGITPFFRQAKYTALSSSIPLVHGTEMLMLRAEAALRKNDIPGAFSLINQQRAFYNLSPLTAPTDITAAWKTFETEKGAVVWLEARRLWDLQRWNAATGPSHNSFLDNRDKCIPISQAEMQSNQNLSNTALPPVSPPVP